MSQRCFTRSMLFSKEASVFRKCPYQTYQTLAAGFLALFCGFGFVNAFGVFEEYYHSTLFPGRPQSDLAWVGSLQIFFIYVANVLSGPTLDRVGPRPLMATFAALFCIGCMITSVCSTYWQLLLAQGLLMGLALSLGFGPMMSCAMQWFGSTDGPVAVAIVVSGSSLGGVLWPIIIRALLDNVGFGWTWRTTGFIGLGILVTATLLAHQAPDTSHSGHHSYSNSASSTFAPDSVELAESGFGRMDQQENPATNSSSTRRFFYAEMLKSRQWLLFLAGFAMVDTGLFYLFFNLPSIGTEVGMSPSLASRSLSILNAASFFGRLVLPLPAPRVGVYNLMLTYSILSSAVIFSSISITSTATALAVGSFYGFFSGGVISLMSPCVHCVTPDKTRLGASVGQFAALIAVPAMIGPPAAGWINSSSGGYHGGALFAGSCMALGATLILICRLCIDRRLLAVV